MSDLDISHDELYIRKEELNGSYIYKDKNHTHFNEQGTVIVHPKFETFDSRNTIQLKKSKEKKKSKQEKEMANMKVMDGAHEFTSQISSILVEKFDGKVMGSDDLNLEVIMQELWGDYQPGEKVKKEKKVKKVRALSGYTYFGQQNKEKINAMVKELDGSKGFLAIQSEEWAKVSKDEKKVWSKKAKDAFEASQSEKDGGEKEVVSESE